MLVLELELIEWSLSLCENKFLISINVGNRYVLLGLRFYSKSNYVHAAQGRSARGGEG